MVNKRPVATLAVLAGIIAVILIIGSGGRLHSIGGFVSRMLSPVSRIFHRAAELVNPKESNGLSLSDLQNRNETVEADNRRLLAENARLLALQEENRRLREYLGFAQMDSASLEMVEVVARGLPEDSWRNREVITLSSGEKDGLRVGLPIISPEGVLMGKITSVKDHLAEACLLYSPDCRLAVGVAEETATIGVAQGDLGLTVRIDFIPQTRELKEGQIIVTSGLESGMPPGLVIGRVSRVIKQANELWQSALVEPSADFETVRLVAVLK